MGQGIRIGTVVGAPVLVSPWWFLVAGFLTLWIAPVYADWLPGLGTTGEYLLGAVFVVLLYLSAFLHELGHAFSARALGLRVHRIELTALGGLTQMDEPPTPGRAAATSFAGPAVNLVLVVVAIGAVNLTPDGTLSHLFAGQLAWTNALVAVFNLLPGLPLDGGAILRAGIWKATGRTGTATVVAAWSGRLVALAAGLWFVRSVLEGGSLFSGILFLLVAFWMWSAGTAALASERARALVPTLVARTLARRVVTVPSDAPVSVVVQRIAEAGAGGAVVTDAAGHVTGIVSEAAVSATPADRRPWIGAGTVARRVDAGVEIDASLAGEDLLRALAAAPASEYLVRETDGSVTGVLALADVQAVLARR